MDNSLRHCSESRGSCVPWPPCSEVTMVLTIIALYCKSLQVLDLWSLGKPGNPSSLSTPFSSLSWAQAAIPWLWSYYSRLPTGFPLSPPVPSCPLLCSRAMWPAHCSQSELSKRKSDHNPLPFSHSVRIKVGHGHMSWSLPGSPAPSHPLFRTARENPLPFSSLDVPCPFSPQHFYTCLYDCPEHPTHMHICVHTHPLHTCTYMHPHTLSLCLSLTPKYHQSHWLPKHILYNYLFSVLISRQYIPPGYAFLPPLTPAPGTGPGPIIILN